LDACLEVDVYIMNRLSSESIARWTTADKNEKKKQNIIRFCLWIFKEANSGF